MAPSVAEPFISLFTFLPNHSRIPFIDHCFWYFVSSELVKFHLRVDLRPERANMRPGPDKGVTHDQINEHKQNPPGGGLKGRAKGKKKKEKKKYVYF